MSLGGYRAGAPSRARGEAMDLRTVSEAELRDIARLMDDAAAVPECHRSVAPLVAHAMRCELRRRQGRPSTLRRPSMVWRSC